MEGGSNHQKGLNTLKSLRKNDKPSGRSLGLSFGFWFKWQVTCDHAVCLAVTSSLRHILSIYSKMDGLMMRSRWGSKSRKQTTIMISDMEWAIHITHAQVTRFITTLIILIVSYTNGCHFYHHNLLSHICNYVSDDQPSLHLHEVNRFPFCKKFYQEFIIKEERRVSNSHNTLYKRTA